MTTAIFIRNYLFDRGKKIASSRVYIDQIAVKLTLLSNQIFCGQINCDQDFDFKNKFDSANSFIVPLGVDNEIIATTLNENLNNVYLSGVLIDYED